YNGGVAVTGATNSNYAATTSGTYTVRVTNSTGCAATTTTPVVATEMGMPVVSAPASYFCEGASVTLTASLTATTGTAYQWQLGGTNITGATNSTYVATVAGVYSYTVTTASGCRLASNSLTVTEHAAPRPVIIYSGGRIRTTTNYIAYQWYRNGAVLFGATAYYRNITDTGHYWVRVTDSAGCVGLSLVYYVEALAVQGVAATTEAIAVFPNPTTGLVNITGANGLRATVQTADGRTLQVANDVQVLDISTYAPGLYLLQLADSDGRVMKTVKLVKE
ncbi:MAG: T9SS C-terminal target domain-containing protein, partial [Chitinophagia bacterium]|nr:T9SS C-terminal target domain-containing protein [Chitinophagia bacterium]